MIFDFRLSIIVFRFSVSLLFDFVCDHLNLVYCDEVLFEVILKSVL